LLYLLFVLINTPVPDPHGHEHSCHEQGQTVADDENEIFDVERIEHDQTDTQRKDAKITYAQISHAFRPVGFDDLWDCTET